MKNNAAVTLSSPGALSPVQRLVLGALERRVRAGTLMIEFPGGERAEILGQHATSDRASLIINDYSMVTALVRGGAMGFAEAYLDGAWTTDSLTDLLHFAARNEHGLGRAARNGGTAKFWNRLRHVLRGNTRRQAQRNIAYHYDLGNDFYRLMLDPSMTYSAGLFLNDSDDLETAQRNKYARLARVAGVCDGDSVLEIGCGWGGFLAYLAKEYLVCATGISISRRQVEYARNRLVGTPLASAPQYRDYRDVSGSFDRIVSIEMFEAVGEQYWSTYANHLKTLLAPGGGAALQVITIDEARFERYRRNPDFIQKYIFPGGMLPSVERLTHEVERADLKVTDCHHFGLDYAKTLRVWRRRFDAAWPSISALGFDERFRRMWHYYLAYCEVGFELGAIDVVQIGLAHPD